MQNLKKKKKMENLNEERDKEMIKRKCKIEKMAENLNKEREGRTDKVMKKKKKRKRRKEKKKKEKERERKEIKKERLLGNFCHCIHACLSSKKNK